MTHYCASIFTLLILQGAFLGFVAYDQGYANVHIAAFSDLLYMLNTSQKIYIFARTARDYKTFNKQEYTYYTKVSLNETDYEFNLFVPPHSRRNRRNADNMTELGGVRPFRLHAKLGNNTEKPAFPGPYMKVENWPGKPNLTKILWQYSYTGQCGIFFFWLYGQRYCELDIREEGLPGPKTHDIYHECQTMYRYTCEYNFTLPVGYNISVH
uniref:Lipocalin n=1 Tax=Rhipicephalus appendiculatus TaxID=34631 RepID=A0A131Z6Q5_RHIAP